MENPTLGFGLLNVRKSGICRLCMKAHEYYLNIFVSNEEFKTSISKAIEDLLVLKVAKDDNLPKIVCCPCVTKLMEFREFKEMCMNSAREFGRHAPVEPIKCPVKDEFLPMQLLGVATSKTWSNCVDGKSGVHITPNDLSLNPFDLENQSDTKEEYPRDPLGESDEGGQEDFAKTESNEDASVCSESKQILMDAQGEVKEELESTELVGNVESQRREIIDEGDSSDTGGPILLSDILAFMGMVGHYNNIGDMTEEPEKESDKCDADRKRTSQNKELDNPSSNPTHDENSQLKYPKPNSFAVECFSQFSQYNDRERPVRNYECEKLGHQAENTSYPTEYICNYCNTRYSEISSLALHIKMHVDGMRSASVLPNKKFSPIFSQNLLVKEFKCIECEKTFSSSSELNTHSVVHTDEKRFKCNDCGKMFTRKGHLKTHLLVHTGVKQFKCNECGKMFTQSGHLKSHLLVHTGVKQFKCNECGKMFTQSGNLKSHLLVHTGVKQFKCNECGKMFTQSGTLKSHLLVHTGVKQFKCNECGKMFTQSGNFKSHLLVHTGVKQFKCNECGKMFTQSGTLKSHLLVHTGVKQFKCNECGKMFTQSGNLKSHLLVHTGVKQFKCNECGKMFTQSGHLRSHLLVHTGVKQFKCNECGKMFTQSGHLRSHLLVHTGVKQFKCNECGKTFSRKGHLSEHSFVHTGVKRFKCNECGMMFTQSGTLKTHSLTHTDVKTFKCNECGKMFTKSTFLKSHLIVHTGLKQFKCNECGKTFSRKGHLSEHSVVHTGVKRFKCHYCGEVFKWRTRLKRHLLSHADRNPSK